MGRIRGQHNLHGDRFVVGALVEQVGEGPGMRLDRRSGQCEGHEDEVIAPRGARSLLPRAV
eukprot:11197342-Lingulodinium_polyedra.AAC.1